MYSVGIKYCYDLRGVHSQESMKSLLTPTYTAYGEEQFYTAGALSALPRFLAINIT